MDADTRRPGYEWLLCDADGTLFDYDRAEGMALGRALEQIGATVQPGCLTAYRQINGGLWRELEQGRITQEKLKVRRFELLFHALGINYSPAAFSTIYLDCLGDCCDTVTGAAEALQSLYGKYRLAVLTNGLQAVQRRRLERSVIGRFIAELIISEAIGCAKPTKAFFDAAFARLGQPKASACLMIGDNWSSDIEGAANYGIDTCWYNPGRQPRPSSPAITCEIVSLGELVAWLK